MREEGKQLNRRVSVRGKGCLIGKLGWVDGMERMDMGVGD